MQVCNVERFLGNNGLPDVNVIFNPVGFIFFKVVWISNLDFIFLFVKVLINRPVYCVKAFLVSPAVMVQYAIILVYSLQIGADVLM